MFVVSHPLTISDHTRVGMDRYLTHLHIQITRKNQRLVRVPSDVPKSFWLSTYGLGCDMQCRCREEKGIMYFHKVILANSSWCVHFFLRSENVLMLFAFSKSVIPAIVKKKKKNPPEKELHTSSYSSYCLVEICLNSTVEIICVLNSLFQLLKAVWCSGSYGILMWCLWILRTTRIK